MGEPPQALSSGPLPTPCWFLPFPPPHRLTPHREDFGTIGLSFTFPASGPATFLNHRHSRYDHLWPPLAPPEPASVSGTEPERKEEEWPFRLSQAPPRTGVRDKGEDQWVGLTGPEAGLPLHWLWAGSSEPGEGRQRGHTSLRATLHSSSPAGGDSMLPSSHPCFGPPDRPCALPG